MWLAIERTAPAALFLAALQCPAGSSWDAETEGIVSLIEQLIREHNVDPAHVYLTGISMGGYGAWDLATKHPELFAAVVPLCGGGDLEEAPALSGISVRAYHGANDEIVPPSETLSMTDALARSGGDVEVIIEPDLGHDLTRVYEDPGLYDWLLRQHRPSS